MWKILTAGILALFISCSDGPGYSISGTIDNTTDGQKVYVSELNENNNQTTTIDTIKIVDGKFEAELESKDAPTISFLTFEGARGNVIFIADNTPIEFEINKDSLFASKVTGGEDNEILYDYLGEIIQTNQEVGLLRGEMMKAYSQQDSVKLRELQGDQQEIIERDQETKRAVVENNPGSIVSLMVLQDMLNTRTFPVSEMKSLFESLSPEIRSTHLGETLKEAIDKRDAVDVGVKAPNFKAPTPEGEELALNDVLGKVTLVDFWASWCKPCRVENPNIVRVYEKYHDKGFNVLGVSLDRPGQKNKWLEAIEEDNLTWNQVSNLMFWQDPIAEKYGIKAIPAAFLLNENGVIVAKNLRGQALEDKVAELLGEE